MIETLLLITVGAVIFGSVIARIGEARKNKTKRESM